RPGDGLLPLFVKIWDAASGKETARLEHPAQASIAGLCWSPDSKRLATLMPPFPDMLAGEIRIWQTDPAKSAPPVKPVPVTEGDKGVLTLQGLRTPIQPPLAFSPDGKFLAARTADFQSIRVWNTWTGQEHSQVNGGRLLWQANPWSKDGESLWSQV